VSIPPSGSVRSPLKENKPTPPPLPPPPPLTHCLQAITGTRVFKNVLKQAEGFWKYKERKISKKSICLIISPPNRNGQFELKEQ
jgi:hypothetical protein